MVGTDDAGMCVDNADYRDSGGDGCSWYEGRANSCGSYDGGLDEACGTTAMSACCACQAAVEEVVEMLEDAAGDPAEVDAVGEILEEALDEGAVDLEVVEEAVEVAVEEGLEEGVLDPEAVEEAVEVVEAIEAIEAIEEGVEEGVIDPVAVEEVLEEAVEEGVIDPALV